MLLSYVCEKAQQLGVKVLAMYDSNGYIYNLILPMLRKNMDIQIII